MNGVKKFLKDWMLIISMVTGASLYLIYRAIPSPELHSAGPTLEAIIKTFQPIALFAMLFLSFCKIKPSDLRPHRWQWQLLLIQAGFYIALCCLLIWAAKSDTALASFVMKGRLPLEAAVLCLICPTATACAVVTGKLGGDMAGVVTYTIIINLVAAVLIPLFLPLVYPVAGVTFGVAFSKIIAKVFPLLILPCLAAWMVRYLTPHLHRFLIKHTELAFYIWAVSLCVACLMSTRAVVCNGNAVAVLVSIALVSLVCCIFQFWAGKKIGALSGAKITAGQALGQKNTVFAIWVGYTFMDPVISVAGGFYCIWHNCYNSWQLHTRK